MKKKEILFVINPKSGVKGKADFPKLIDRYIDKNRIEYEIAFTKAPKHGVQLSHEAASKGFYAVIAVGGDGSVNEVAEGLMGYETALGFMATGSGNGLARHLKIPMNYRKAISVINTGKTERIDTFKVNDLFGIGTLGIGFDGHVAHLFAESSKRGFATYAKVVLKEFYKYKPLKYEMMVDGEDFETTSFLLTFANSSQFGNNAVIAPFADVRDGILDISMIRKFPVAVVPPLLYRLMNNSIQKSKFFNSKRGKDIIVKNNAELRGHIDGEPVIFASDLHIKVVPSSLNVLVPR